MRPHGPPEPGTILLGKYRVERALGTGGMGVVVEATHVALEQRVAIKLLSNELAQSPEIAARFLREARIAAKLSSNHVTKVTDIGQTEAGTPYIVMELLVGHDLATELSARGSIPVSEAVDFILEACEGLAEAHGAGLVHRDIKPANLFLTQRPNRPPIVKVLDFGLSKEPPSDTKASLTATDSIFGTPQYMSPEQIRSTKNVDARTDQHAIAMILFELITGRPAFDAANVSHLVVLIATAPPPRIRDVRPDVPAKLEAVLLRALAKKPAERFADLGDFAEAIAPFGGPEAKQRAKHVKAALVPRDSLLPPAPPARASGPMSDELTTAQLIPVRSNDLRPSDSALAGDFERFRRERRKQGLIAMGVMGAIVVAIVVAILFARGPSSDEPASAPAATQLGGVDPRGPAGPEVRPGPVDPAGSAAPMESASAPAASSNPSGAAGAGADKRPKPSGSGGRAGAPPPAVSSILGAFGERKK